MPQGLEKYLAMWTVSNPTAGEKSVIAFKRWSASMTDDDYRQIVFRCKLNRGEVAKGCGIAKAALRQNTVVADLLFKLEEDLRFRNVLPDMTEEYKAKQKQPQKHDQNASRRGQDARRASLLEKENIELRAEIKALKRELQRYRELSDIMTELGIMPR